MNISLPSNTDPTKTYQWRYFNHFLQRLKEWQIDDEGLVAKIIAEVVSYASEHKLLSRGASILSKDNILDICHEKIKQELINDKSLIVEIRRSYNAIKGKTKVDLIKSDGKEFPLIVSLFQSGKISCAVLSLSSKCWRSVLSLQGSDRECIPSNGEILKARISYFNRCGADELVKIFGDDLLKRI